MSASVLLAGIVQQRIKTECLVMTYLQTGSGKTPVVLIHGNCSSSLFFQDFMLALAASGRYTIYAPDMRGYGDSETLPVDATRGVRDYSDDLAAFVRVLHLPRFHLLGWSLGGNIVMQYAIDYPESILSLTLEAPGSPFGFGGTRDVLGTPSSADFAGSGGGTANPDFAQRMANGDRGSEQNSPRSVMNAFYFKPPFRVAPDREEMYVTAILSTKVGPGNYAGDMTNSEHWPHVAPGVQGVNNALSPKYLKQTAFAQLPVKVPVLWIHGVDDQIVSDTSLFDLAFLGQLGAVPDWPGAEVCPPQPMKAQIRAVLEQYKANGGSYQEVALPDCGHSPHIEKQDDVVRLFLQFTSAE